MAVLHGVTVLRNGLYNAVGGIIRTILILAAIPLVIRLVGAAEYGLWSLAFAFLGMMALAEAGLSGATTVFAARDLGKQDSGGLAQTLLITLLCMTVLATAAALVLLFGSDFIAGFFSKLTETERATVTKALKISSVVLWARLLQQVFIGIQQAFQSYGILNTVQTLQSAMVNGGMIVVAWNGGRAAGFMTLHAVVGLLALLGHAAAACWLLRGRLLAPRWSWNKFRDIVHFGSFNWTACLGSVLFTNADRLIVGGLLNTGVLGVYAAITSITAQINAISGLPVQPLLASMSHRWAAKTDATGAKREVRFALKLNAFIAFGMGAAIFMLAPDILRFLLPNDAGYMTTNTLRVAAVIYALYSLNATGYFIMPAIGELGLWAIILVSGGVLSLALIAAGSYFWGLAGAVAGNAGFLITLWMLRVAMNKIQVPVSEWLDWVRFPLVWYAIAIVASSILPARTQFQLPLLLVCTFILISLPLRENRSHIQQRWRAITGQTGI